MCLDGSFRLPLAQPNCRGCRRHGENARPGRGKRRPREKRLRRGMRLSVLRRCPLGLAQAHSPADQASLTSPQGQPSHRACHHGVTTMATTTKGLHQPCPHDEARCGPRSTKASAMASPCLGGRDPSKCHIDDVTTLPREMTTTTTGHRHHLWRPAPPAPRLMPLSEAAAAATVLHPALSCRLDRAIPAVAAVVAVCPGSTPRRARTRSA